MNLAISLPTTNVQALGAKDVVIAILSERWPLSAKEIHHVAVTQHGKDVSYQAIHKILGQFVEEKVVAVSGKRYQLSKDWISKLQRFTSALALKYENSVQDIERNLSDRNAIQLSFDDYSEMVVTLAELMARKVLCGGGNDFAAAMFQHLYWPFNFRFQDFLLLRKLIGIRKETYIMCKSNSAFDRWAYTQYKKANITELRLGQNFSGDDDILVDGESIIQVQYSSNTKKIIDGYYEKIADLGGLMLEFTAPSSPRHSLDIQVKITKNKPLADILFNQIKKEALAQPANGARERTVLELLP